VAAVIARVGAASPVTDIAATYDACGRELYGYCAGVARDAGIAEEVVQEAFARLIREQRAGRYPENPRAWLYTVATNLLRMRARRLSIVERWWRGPGRQTEEVDAAAEDVVLRRERTSELSRALADLPSESRAALLLAADGFSGREIAELLGRSEGATRNLMWRARLALRDQLSEAGAR
jgi:RNA polymerase sigma-70 factor, ECF subfamily